MRKLIILLMIGGMLALPVLADLRFSALTIGPNTSERFVEVGATATVDIIYTNNTGGSVNIDAAKFYLDYVNGILEQSSIRLTNLHSNNFKIAENNTATNGFIRFQISTDPTAGQTPLAVANNSEVALARIEFHVPQTDALVRNENYFIRFTQADPTNNVRVVDSGRNVTGSITNPTEDNAFRLDSSAAPVFEGLNTAVDTTIGNTVDLNWTGNADGANDRSQAETLYGTGQRLRFNVFAAGTQVGTSLNQIAFMVGPDTGVPSTIAGQILNYGTAYSFYVSGLDACTPRANEQVNAGTRNNAITTTPTDTTPPPQPTLSVAPGNQQNTLTIGGLTAPDTGGIIIIRRDNGQAVDPATAGQLSRADAGTPYAHGMVISEGADLLGGKVVFAGYNSANRGSSAQNAPTRGEIITSYTDSGLVNGQLYNYRVIAYDRAIGNTAGGDLVEMGRNASAASANQSAAPGVSPGAIVDFFATSRPEAGKIRLDWTNPGEGWFGGVIIFATANPNAKWSAIPDSNDDWATAVDNQTMNIIGIYQPADATAVLRQPVNLVIDSNLTADNVYFFKAFAFNAIGRPYNLSDAPAYRYSDPTIAAAIPAPQAGERVVEVERAGDGSAQEVTLTLSKRSGGFGVNSLGVPFNPPFEANGRTVSTLQELLNALNANKVVVRAVSYWDRDAGKILGAVIDEQGNRTWETVAFNPNRPLAAGQGYYFSVSEDVNLVLHKAPAGTGTATP